MAGPAPGPAPRTGTGRNAEALLLEPDECVVFGCRALARHGYPMCPEHSAEYRYGDGGYRGPALQLDMIRAVSGRVGNCWEHRLACGARGYTRVRYAGRHWPLHRLAAVLDCILQCGPAEELAGDPVRMVLHDIECEYLYRRGLLARRCVNPAHLRWGGAPAAAPAGAEGDASSARENADDILRVQLMIDDHARGLSDREVYEAHGCAWSTVDWTADGGIAVPPVGPATYDLAEHLLGPGGTVSALGRSEG